MYKEAIAANLKAGELSPAWEWGLAYTYSVAGYRDKALHIVDKLEKRNLSWDTWCLAVVYITLGDMEKVFYWLEQAYERRHPFITWISPKHNSYFRAAKDDPRLKVLIKRMDLAE